MKLVTIVLFFLSLTQLIQAQKPTSKGAESTKVALLPAYSTYEWKSDNLHIGLSSTYMQGELMQFVKPVVAITLGAERHNRHMYAVNLTIRPIALRQGFTNDNAVWNRDTSVGFVTFQGSFGYQYWASKRVALYLFGSFGFHSIAPSGDNQSNNNNVNGPRKNTSPGFSLVSLAPSGGFFLDFRQRKGYFSQAFGSYGYHDSYWRMKFSVNPAWFQKIGSGVLFDSGIAYCL
jgi:hypothetical protein